MRKRVTEKKVEYLTRLQAELKGRLEKGPVVMGKDIQLIVVSNGNPNMQMTLTEMYDALGVEYTHIKVENTECVRRWSWKCKIVALHQHFQQLEATPAGEGEQRPRYFFVSDVGDVLLNRLPVDEDILAAIHAAYGHKWGAASGACVCVLCGATAWKES